MSQKIAALENKMKPAKAESSKELAPEFRYRLGCLTDSEMDLLIRFGNLVLSVDPKCDVFGAYQYRDFVGEFEMPMLDEIFGVLSGQLERQPIPPKPKGLVARLELLKTEYERRNMRNG